MALKKKTAQKPRGFQCVDADKLAKICRKGGRTTARVHGPEHMSTIGRNGRMKRTLAERKAKRDDAAIVKALTKGNANLKDDVVLHGNAGTRYRR